MTDKYWFDLLELLVVAIGVGVMAAAVMYIFLDQIMSKGDKKK